MKRGLSGINCLLALNKPRGMSSHDVVSRVRRILGERRVGHAGTLDPEASGVLVVGVGQGTRLMGLLTMDNKAYRAVIEFGSETTTDDAEGEVVRTAPIPPALHDFAHASEVVSSLVGTVDQVPPAFSAISVGGRRAYDRARHGEEVVLAPRRITINSSALVGIMEKDPLSWVCDFDVSKGTYIRSIARDLGRSVGSAAHLSALERRASGTIDIASCVTLDALAEAGSDSLGSLMLDPVQTLGYATLELDDKQLLDVQCGKRMRAPKALLEGTMVSLVHGTQLVGVWQKAGSALVCKANFPAGIDGVGGQ